VSCRRAARSQVRRDLEEGPVARDNDAAMPLRLDGTRLPVLTTSVRLQLTSALTISPVSEQLHPLPLFP